LINIKHNTAGDSVRQEEHVYHALDFLVYLIQRKIHFSLEGWPVIEYLSSSIEGNEWNM